MKALLSALIKIPAFLEFALFYLKEVILSNIKVAADVLTPTHYMEPAMLHLPVEGLSDRQVLVLSNLITMTPGTLSIDVDDTDKMLIIHGMYVKDAAVETEQLEKNYIRRVKNVF